MSRVYNFSAGPAVLPEQVLREAAEEMMDYRGTGPVCTKMRTRIYYKKEDFIAWLERAEGEYRVEDYTQYGVRIVRNSGEEEVSPR